MNWEMRDSNFLSWICAGVTFVVTPKVGKTLNVYQNAWNNCGRRSLIEGIDSSMVHSV